MFVKQYEYVDIIKPKHTIRDDAKFNNDRAMMGHFIIEGMDATGGTDIDFMIEHRGGFIFLESKRIDEYDSITIPWGQMIGFENLYKKLKVHSQCYFFFFAHYVDLNYNDANSIGYYFEMNEWLNNEIKHEKKTTAYRIKRENIHAISLKNYRKILDDCWHKFEKRT